MIVKIPATINVSKLLKKESLTRTRSKNLKDKIHYFLSVLTRTNDNVEFLYDGEGYKKICSCIQKQIHGNEDFYKILKILENAEEPIIERNKKWNNSKNSTGVCQGYRIIKKYDTGKIKTVSVNKALSKRIKENFQSHIKKSYKFLTDQYKNNTISIDPKVYEYLKNYYSEIHKKINKNEYQTMVLKNHVGRWLEYIDKINKNDIWCKVSNNNHRLNSTLTSIPKELRKFILVNNQPLESIDIKCSQPYILSSIIKTRYFLENKKGYNLKTIHPEIHERVIKSINESNKFYHNNKIINPNSPYIKTRDRSYLYMWYEFLGQKEAESLVEYGLYPFKKDFYLHILEKNPEKKINENQLKKEELREKLKNVMMLILFDDNFRNRNNNYYINLFKEVYPGVNNWIERIHRLIGKQEFAYMMQRTESYLMLNSVCREFNKKFKTAPIFTIHDALYTTKEYISELSEITKNTLEELTKVAPGIKHSCEAATVLPDKDIINSRWEKIKVYDTKKRFEKIEHTILAHNINLAQDFLNSTENR